jgi:outer membrane protein assembly factor BamA
MSYPFSTFQRIEASVNVAYSVKDLYTYPRRPRHAYLVSDYVSYIRDTSLWGPTGPIDGNRINLTLGYTVDVKFSNVNYYTIIADYRKYFRLSTRMAYAVRLMTQYNEGKEARLFYFGGSWDIRGYKLWSLVGKKAVLVNNEFRFPFIDTFDIRFPFLTMSFNAIRGAIFFDAGNIWNSKWGGEKFTIGESGIEDFSKSSGFIGSFGAGVRLNIGGPLVLRLDFGRRTNFRTISKENFTQFFFGWDF